MDISSIYVHDGTLLRVIEDRARSRLMMEVELPIIERDDQLEPQLLVFEDVYGYQVLEGYINGCPRLLDLSVVGQEGRWTRIRLDTTVGYREILCGSVRVCGRKELVEPAATLNSRPPSQLPTSPKVQAPDSLRMPPSGGCG
jgi:hypothetical protein